MTERSSTDRPDATLGKAPTSTEPAHHPTEDLADSLDFMRREGVDGVLERFTFTEDEIHFDTGEMPQLLVNMLADFIRGVAALTEKQVERLRSGSAREGVDLVKQVLSERGGR